jgi:hypothetical protein
VLGLQEAVELDAKNLMSDAAGEGQSALAAWQAEVQAALEEAHQAHHDTAGPSAAGGAGCWELLAGTRVWLAICLPTTAA